MTLPFRIDNSRIVRSPRGPALSAKSWATEAPLRMLMNNLDAEVAERPHELVVYGGIGRAARDWDSFDRIVTAGKTFPEFQRVNIRKTLDALKGAAEGAPV